MTIVTPPRPLDVAGRFPEMAELGRVATRLHPRLGEPGVLDSSIGGPLLWPADEPWPVHAQGEQYAPLTNLSDIRTLRALITESWARPQKRRGPRFTPEEREILDSIRARHPPESMPDARQPLIPLAQLYARDTPTLPYPEGTDLLQLLWAPCYGIEGCSSAVQLRWRSAAQVGEVLTTPPEPAYVLVDEHVPEPCLLHPEQVHEYPPGHLLPEELHARLKAWALEHSVSYRTDLCIAPGCKAGGWPARFSFRDAADDEERHCGECGGPLDALMTIDSFEWDASTTSWQPTGDLEEPRGHPYRSLRDATMLMIGRGYTLQIYYCRRDPAHLPRAIMQ